MLTDTDISQDFALQIGTYFLLVPKMKIYTRCKLVDENGIKLELEKIFGFNSNPYTIWKSIADIKGNR